MKEKTVKAWAVLLTDKKKLECSFPSKEAAQTYATQFYGAQVVPCTITYEI